MAIGAVKRLNQEKGYGFIGPENGSGVVSAGGLMLWPDAAPSARSVHSRGGFVHCVFCTPDLPN